MNLTDLANKWATDKGTQHFEKHGYTDFYQRLVESLGREDISLLEIGLWANCGPGASAMMWREFLPKAKLYGIEINPESRVLEEKADMRVFIADQGNREQMVRVMEQIGPVDFVIDDGSHFINHIWTSLEAIWPYVTPGGYYVVEDLHVPTAQPRHQLDLFARMLAGVHSTTWAVDEKLFVLEKVKP